MFIRVDPSRSAGSDLFIMDSDASLDALKNRDSLPCAAGGHQRFPSTTLQTSQDITCDETGDDLFTIIYLIQP